MKHNYVSISYLHYTTQNQLSSICILAAPKTSESPPLLSLRRSHVSVASSSLRGGSVRASSWEGVWVEGLGKGKNKKKREATYLRHVCAASSHTGRGIVVVVTLYCPLNETGGQGGQGVDAPLRRRPSPRVVRNVLSTFAYSCLGDW